MVLLRFAELGVQAIIFTFGIIFNSIVLRNLWIARRYRRRMNHGGIKSECLHALVMNLTMADLMILLISIPTDIVPEHISWPYGLCACKFVSPLQDVCLTASALTFSAIALERYYVSKGKAHNESHAIIVLAVIWTTSCLTMGLPMAIHKQLISDDEMVMCDVIWPNKNVANFFLCYMIVLIGASAMTGIIVYCRIR
ncbi:prokineticin receptor 2-like [Xenia sp. Carnegie-2017]|uniref:prokineticin receptor 2-like n=1 Tax=Xenia sp. Carnegie-2017 TaxID=2897299 RepID=UPI001F03D4DA|nr:prokineticin receptor 2-like [Xenia sp. Carnegie-2017]XP_046858871.1 prokineticin receptor 2-like [Xenia sp. Carnegie-2017]